MSDRRSCRAGGRRASDRPTAPCDPPECPACGTPGVASLAGESDGGWWFVCLACDHLWDQRLENLHRIERDQRMAPEPPAVPDRAFPLFWQRSVFRRATSFVSRLMA